MDRRVLSATLTVPLPPEEAFRLFTARGERDWVPGWAPVFPVDTPDDTAPGTVWLSSSPEEETTWLVTSREFPRSVSYARITPGVHAGTVTVALAATEAGSEVTVTYDMSPSPRQPPTPSTCSPPTTRPSSVPGKNSSPTT
ncbi:SRPBCC family protein [Streptomyces sp. NPDC085540]|uniref:SRPBCC family protein n=1 Tax=Streptomyces sp. NPDC085540 TaxID=3365730 RepID=UPI0037D59ED8